MYTNGGIEVDAWVRIEDGCRVEWKVIGEEAEFSLSGRRSGLLCMVATEEGLATVHEHLGKALAELRSADLGELGAE